MRREDLLHRRKADGVPVQLSDSYYPADLAADTELADPAGEWLFDRRERLEKHEREGIALVWLALSEIEAILRGFDA